MSEIIGAGGVLVWMIGGRRGLVGGIFDVGEEIHDLYCRCFERRAAEQSIGARHAGRFRVVCQQSTINRRAET